VDIISAVTGIVLLLAAAWEWRQLVRHPGDPGVPFLAVGLTGIGLIVALSLPFPLFKPAADLVASTYTANIAWTVVIYCYSAFFLVTSGNAPEGAPEILAARRRAAREFLGVILAAALMFLALKTGTWHSPRIPADYRTWQNLLFYLSVDGYPLAVWILGTCRAVGSLRRFVHVWAQVAVFTVIVGVSAMVIGVDGVSLLRQGLYIAFPGSKWPSLRTWYNVGRIGGQILLSGGLVIVPLATAVGCMKDRVDLRLKKYYLDELAPLWSRLTTVFPEVMLPVKWDELGGAEARFERMTTEITGGLAELAPYCSHYSTAGLTRPHQAAVVISEALAKVEQNQRSRWAGELYEPHFPPYSSIEPEFGVRWRKRAGWMANVGRKLEKLPSSVRERRPQDDLQAP